MNPAPGDHSSAAKRARILRAAFEVCEQRGVAGARMEEVSARAGVSKGTLYRFFSSKEELFFAALIDSYAEGLRIGDSAVTRAADPRAQLDAQLEGLVRALASLAPRMGVFYQAWGVAAKRREFRVRLHDFLRDLHGLHDEQIAGAIRAGQRLGLFREDVDVAAVTHGITALLGGFLYRATFDPGRANAQALRACFNALVRERLAPG